MSAVGIKANLSGVVQGVGFRFWCYQKAREMDICGYVANLPDGSVEVIAEGNRGLIEEFLKALKIGPSYAHIADIKLQWYEKPVGYSGFSIEYKD